LVLSGLAGGLLALPQPSLATTLVAKSLADLTARSPIVVHGRVVQVEVNSRNGRRTAIVEALDVVRAPADYRAQRDFPVPLHNRALPRSDLVEWVPAAPELFEGEELVLFLRPLAEDDLAPSDRRLDGKTSFALDGFQQGKFRVASDERGVRRVLGWDQAPDPALEPARLKAVRTTVRRGLGKLATPPLDPVLTKRLGGEPAVQRLPTLAEVLDRARSER